MPPASTIGPSKKARTARTNTNGLSQPVCPPAPAVSSTRPSAPPATARSAWRMLATSAKTSAPASCNGCSTGAGEPTEVITSSGLWRSRISTSCARRALDRCTIRFGQTGDGALPLASAWRCSRSPISVSQASSCSTSRQLTVGNAPITPLRQAATTSSTPETRNMGAAISGSFNRSRKRARVSLAGKAYSSRLEQSCCCASVRHWHDRMPNTKQRQATGRTPMSDPLHALPVVGEQTLRALARYPSRTAFSWPGGTMTYRAATDLIGRMQGVLAKLGFAPGTRVAFLTANRADSWCAGTAAQLSRLATTFLHPLGSLEDQLFQLEDSEAEMLIVDGTAFRDRGGDLAARANGLKMVFTLGPAGYGADLLQAAETAGSATARCFAGPDDLSTLSYTGGTTGKSKGALRYHHQLSGFATAILADFEIPDTPSYLTVAPISHVAGTKVLPTLMRGGTVPRLKRFDP